MPRRSFALFSLVLGVGPLAACSSPRVPASEQHESDESAVEGTSSTSAALSGSVTRSAAIANAESWVAAQLAYCQSPNGKPDPDTSCASTCTRTANSQWDPYRSDCSGFISWAWELPAPGLTTAGYAPYDTSASTAIACADMKPGDAANRSPNRGHIVLFKEWVTPGTEAVFIEEPGCSASQPYAHEFTSAVTCSGTNVDIAYEGATFEAIRYVNIQDDPDAGGAGVDAGSGHADAGAGDTDARAGSEADAGGSVGTQGSAGTGSSDDAGAQGTGAGANQGAGGLDGGAPAVGWEAPGASASCGVAPGPKGPKEIGWTVGAMVAFGLLGARRRRFRASRVSA